MKIAFDEHVPPGLARVFQTLANERQIRRTVGSKSLPKQLDVVLAKDYTPSPHEGGLISKTDAHWIAKFAQDGGRFIISGDTRMIKVPQELRALIDHGMIIIFFDGAWNNSGFFEKCALILKHWELIVVSFRTASPPALLKLPSVWTKLNKITTITAPKGKIEPRHNKRPTPPSTATAQKSRKPEVTPASEQGTLTLPSSTLVEDGDAED